MPTNRRFQGCIKVGDKLLDLSEPRIMGIVNLTPDSFYAPSRKQNAEAVAEQVRRMIAEGASIIDVGACSTRPDSVPATPEEEAERLRKWLSCIMNEAKGKAAVSIDTFRADIAKMAVEEYGVEIVNDISGGNIDHGMFRTVAHLRVPYVLTHSQDLREEANPIPAMLRQTSRLLAELRGMGVSDVIYDPGFGFGKTLEQNYHIMAALSGFCELGVPLLVGISRKSMLWRLLNTTPEETLNATTALNTIALLNGANILRVHDVREAAEALKIVNQTLCSLSE